MRHAPPSTAPSRSPSRRPKPPISACSSTVSRRMPWRCEDKHNASGFACHHAQKTSCPIEILERNLPDFTFALFRRHTYLHATRNEVDDMELGLYTFADVDPAAAAKGPEGARRLKNLLEEIELADQVGLDVFGLGEHHRPDYAASAPATILAAAAVNTKK